MSWKYDRATGFLSLLGKQGFPMCYAGYGPGLNNCEMEKVHDVGPLPRGTYRMTAMVNSPHTGPNTIILEPLLSTVMYGRSGFRIHGDNPQENDTASRGCIILPGGWRRLAVWESGDHELEVV